MDLPLVAIFWWAEHLPFMRRYGQIVAHCCMAGFGRKRTLG